MFMWDLIVESWRDELRQNLMFSLLSDISPKGTLCVYADPYSDLNEVYRGSDVAFGEILFWMKNRPC